MKIRLMFVVLAIVSILLSFNAGVPSVAVTAAPTLKIFGYMENGLKSDVKVNQLTSGIWFALTPSSPTNMTLVKDQGGSISDCLAAINACHSAGIPCLASIYAPWDTAGTYNAVFKDTSIRDALFSQIGNILNKYDFDGINMDWESDNASNVTAQQITDFYKALYNYMAVNFPGKTISATENYGKVVMTTEAANYLDWIGLMVYDLGQPVWYGTMDQTIKDMNRWANAGFPKEKIILGISFAGRLNGEMSSWVSYRSIVDNYNPDPSLNETHNYYYNGIDLVTEKTQWVKDNGFGGVFVFEVNLDKLNDSRSLLQNIYDTFDDGTIVVIDDSVNNLPVADNKSVTTNIDTAVDIVLTASDADGDALFFFAQTQPLHGTLSGTAPVLTYTPSAGYYGTDSFTYTVTDGKGNSTGTVTITVNQTHQTDQTGTVTLYENYKTINNEDNIYGSEWKGQTFTPATSHTVTKIRLPLLRVGSPAGNVVVSIRKTDANGLPTGSNLAAGSIPCSTLIAAWSPTTWYEFNLGTGCKLEAGTKYVLLISAPSATSSNAVYYSINTAGTYSKGEVVYSHNSGTTWGTIYANWDAAFEEYGISDSSNRAPVLINNIPDQTFAENTTLPNAINLNNYFSDPDGNVLSYTCSGASKIIVTISSGMVSFSAPANWNGVENITFTASDGTLKAEDTIAITVSSGNNPPVADNKSVTTNSNTAVNIVLTASDIDGDELYFTLETQPAHGTLSGTAPVLTYTPSSGYYGTDSFTYTVTDGKGNSTGTVTITVNQTGQTGQTDQTGTVALYENYETINNEDNIYGNEWKGQTFTPAASHTITKIRLPLLRVGSPAGNVVVSIRKTDANGLPTGSNLATGSIPCSTLIAAWSPTTWYEFNLGTGCKLEAGTKYVLLISAPSATSSNAVYNSINTAGTYSKGEVVYSHNGGTTWKTGGLYKNWDAAFEEWGY